MLLTSRTLARAITAVALAAAPSVARAQQTLDPVHVSAAPVARADRLEAEAAALPSELAQFPKAARLYEEAAAARPFGETRTAQSLRTAAFYRYHSGNSAASVRLLERAAENALAAGDVVAAANSYIDAALVADEMRATDRSVDLAQRAERLSRSPLLDATQRGALRTRIANPTAVALLDHP